MVGNYGIGNDVLEARRRNRKRTLAHCSRCGFVVKLDVHSQVLCQRYTSMAQLRQTMTLDGVGQILGMSGERVRQILKRQKGRLAIPTTDAAGLSSAAPVPPYAESERPAA